MLFDTDIYSTCSVCFHQPILRLLLDSLSFREPIRFFRSPDRVSSDVPGTSSEESFFRGDIVPGGDPILRLLLDEDDHVVAKINNSKTGQ
jgi:hypothetical protein